jgi:hypothetical protein
MERVLEIIKNELKRFMITEKPDLKLKAISS